MSSLSPSSLPLSKPLEDLLIVEDDARLRHLLTVYCTKRQLSFTCVASAMEAIILLTERRFGAVLTDFEMPMINGLELAQWIRNNQPSVNICLMSSAIFTREARALIDAVTDRWLEKPFFIKDLDECLSQIIPRWPNLSGEFLAIS